MGKIDFANIFFLSMILVVVRFKHQSGVRRTIDRERTEVLRGWKRRGSEADEGAKLKRQSRGWQTVTSGEKTLIDKCSSDLKCLNNLIQ